jgi:hypothetical protein
MSVCDGRVFVTTREGVSDVMSASTFYAVAAERGYWKASSQLPATRHAAFRRASVLSEFSGFSKDGQQYVLSPQDPLALWSAAKRLAPKDAKAPTDAVESKALIAALFAERRLRWEFDGFRALNPAVRTQKRKRRSSSDTPDDDPPGYWDTEFDSPAPRACRIAAARAKSSARSFIASPSCPRTHTNST